MGLPHLCPALCCTQPACHPHCEPCSLQSTALFLSTPEHVPSSPTMAPQPWLPHLGWFAVMLLTLWLSWGVWGQLGASSASLCVCVWLVSDCKLLRPTEHTSSTVSAGPQSLQGRCRRLKPTGLVLGVVVTMTTVTFFSGPVVQSMAGLPWGWGCAQRCVYSALLISLLTFELCLHCTSCPCLCQAFFS